MQDHRVTESLSQVVGNRFAEQLRPFERECHLVTQCLCRELGCVAFSYLGQIAIPGWGLVMLALTTNLHTVVSCMGTRCYTFWSREMEALSPLSVGVRLSLVTF